ncbi:hypothetical protein PLICRDRAFT_510438 [Plicaturopsis crispa FD-325 SS-3]|nr:hypothetical protein PLICRDRAFT_510438 [Plicaturopsis crispa FD-325 SS-3]
MVARIVSRSRRQCCAQRFRKSTVRRQTGTVRLACVLNFRNACSGCVMWILVLTIEGGSFLVHSSWKRCMRTSTASRATKIEGREISLQSDLESNQRFCQNTAIGGDGINPCKYSTPAREHKGNFLDWRSTTLLAVRDIVVPICHFARYQFPRRSG